MGTSQLANLGHPGFRHDAIPRAKLVGLFARGIA
jgi:hypothetical protein